MREARPRHTQIQARATREHPFHCHHEKTIVIDGEVAFVGGIDLTDDGRRPLRHPSATRAGDVGWHDVATAVEGRSVADVAAHFRTALA